MSVTIIVSRCFNSLSPPFVLFGVQASRSSDEKILGKRKSGSVEGISSFGKPDAVENIRAKRAVRVKARPVVEPEADKEPEPGADKKLSPDKELKELSLDRGLGSHSRLTTDIPPNTQNFTESILGILEDDVPETDDYTHFMALKGDVNIDTEIAASNLPLVDQDLMDAVNDPIILHAAASLSLREMVDEAEPSPARTPFCDVQDAIREADRNAAVFVMNSLREKLLKTIISDLPSCAGEVEQYFDYATAKGAEVSVLQAQVKKYLAVGLKLHSARRNFSDQSSISQYEEQISVIKEKLSVNASLEKQSYDEAVFIREKLQTALSRQDQLNEELAELNVRVTQLNASLTVAENTHSEHVGEGRNLLSEQSSLEGSLAAASAEFEGLEGLEQEFAEEHAILKDLAWSP